LCSINNNFKTSIGYEHIYQKVESTYQKREGCGFEMNV